MMSLKINKGNGLVYLGSGSLIGMALCYLGLFIIYGFLLSTPSELNDKITYLIEFKTLIKATYLIGYILFAIFLCISTQIIHRLYGHRAEIIINTASLFGFFWALVLLCSGMIGITGLEFMASSDQNDQLTQQLIYHSTLLMVESLGGGIEVLGGIWVFLIGVAGWCYKLFSKMFSVFSVMKGIIGIATLVASEGVLRDLFGLTGIIWFFWMSTIMLKSFDFRAEPHAT